MAACAWYDKTAVALSVRIIPVLAEPLVLKRKNHSWRPVGKRSPLEKFGYILGETIGKGPYSKIKLAYNPKKQEQAAVKIIIKAKIPRKIFDKFIKREIYVMQQVQHPHIIGVNEVAESKNHIFIVMEYAQNGDLLEYVNESGVLSEAEARRLFRQIVAAVKVLHEAHVVHRDIKLDNILLDRDNNVKLADFGFSRLQSSHGLCKTFCGSYAYAAPEILDGEPYDGYLADVWSLGVCLYGMLHGRVPFHEEDTDILRLSMDEEICINAGITKECFDLIHSMLTVDRSKRVTLADIVASPWMAMPLVTKYEDAEDDLDSTWSIISRREPLGAGGSVSTSTFCGERIRNVEDPRAPTEHGYNIDQHHAREAASTTVTDILTAVAISNCSGGRSSCSLRTIGTDIGVKGAVGRKIASELQSISQCSEFGVCSATKLVLGNSAELRRRSLLAVSLKRISTHGGSSNNQLIGQGASHKSLVSERNGSRTSIHGGRSDNQVIGQGASHKSLVSELNGLRTSIHGGRSDNQVIGQGASHTSLASELNALKYTGSGKVANYLGEEQRNSSTVLRKKSLQRMGSLESRKGSGSEVHDVPSSITNFYTKFQVAKYRDDDEN